MFILAALSCIALVAADGGHQPQPYKFGYSIKDKHGEQHRDESGNGAGAVVGSYGFTDNKGIGRQVNYVADKAGFRAQVKTNEPGTANQNPAAVQVISNDPYSKKEAESYGYEGYSNQMNGYGGYITVDTVTKTGNMEITTMVTVNQMGGYGEKQPWIW
ncbi:uncharacterized protein CEXT_37611 [Caerostris extrusa]|uniref:Uncharacterized protein n=1 Tax=Caerostris extrusa TaxID=172846 RepID=A0AAV4R550_CAEEX|nr:uncharacterized protein CEXT_37611 [Caerostris extrusa]